MGSLTFGRQQCPILGELFCILLVAALAMNVPGDVQSVGRIIICGRLQCPGPCFSYTASNKVA
jgi:hypothetical protein